MKRFFMTFAASLSLCLCMAQTPPITPAWALGHIVWEDSINTTVGANRIVDGYLERNIPVDAIIIDSPWSTAYNNFEWDKQRYAEPYAMLKGFSDKGIRTILWLTGNVNLQSRDTRIQKSNTYDEVVGHNYGVNNSQPYKWWKGFGQHIDFTNPEARKWWNTQLDKVFNEYVSGWKVDQGEVWLPDTFDTSIGKMSNEAFRHYYYDAMYDYTVNRRPSDGIIIARPFSHQGGREASVEKMNLGWCGDFSGDWKGLRHQINNIYRSSQYGYGAVGCEVGGFFKKKSTRKEFIRYAQFGAMTACIINGGENGAFSSHVPWYHGEDILQSYRWCVNWMKELVPYKFSTLVDAHHTGGSLLRYTSIDKCSHQLGADIFTQAIVSDSDEVMVSLPNEGEWIDFWSGEKYKAGEQVHRIYDIQQFPLFIKSGAIIPMHINNGVTGMGDESMKNKRVFVIWPNGTSSRNFHLPEDDGIAYFDCQISYNQKTCRLTLHSEKSAEWVFIVKGKKMQIKQASGRDVSVKL